MTAVSPPPPTAGHERSLWRTVAIPSEHGGWGLTLEPALLGLLLAFSWPGVAIGLTAFLAFLLRTPLKLAAIDRRRHRSLTRSRLAARIAGLEGIVLVTLVASAAVASGWHWLLPIAVAGPLFGVELWFDVRSRSRRLLPELCGAVGISAVAASIIIAGDASGRLAIAAWMIVAGRALASIPYVRTQIRRTRHGSASLGASDGLQVAGVSLAAVAVAVDYQVVLGGVAVAVLAVAQAVATRRRHIPPVKVIGMRQMAVGLAVVAATALGAIV